MADAGVQSPGNADEDLKVLLHTFETLRRYSGTIDLDVIAVKTVSLEGQLLTKKTIHDKDTVDCAIIERALKALKDMD